MITVNGRVSPSGMRNTRISWGSAPKLMKLTLRAPAATVGGIPSYLYSVEVTWISATPHCLTVLIWRRVSAASNSGVFIGAAVFVATANLAWRPNVATSSLATSGADFSTAVRGGSNCAPNFCNAAAVSSGVAFELILGPTSKTCNRSMAALQKLANAGDWAGLAEAPVPAGCVPGGGPGVEHAPTAPIRMISAKIIP